jgi:hypothetical protein
VTVPKFAEGKSMFLKFNQAPLDSKERSQPVPYTEFLNSIRLKKSVDILPTL